jgi:hypothetical protein
MIRISALTFSWGLPGSFLGLPGDLVIKIINKEVYRKPQKASRKPKEAIRNFWAEILTIFLLLFWSKP